MDPIWTSVMLGFGPALVAILIVILARR